MGLQEVWFILIAVLFIGYFVLEGFDFGVGMLMPVLGRRKDPNGDTRRRVVLNTIGPVWDGNEVWLITAGGALFAAFPEWYATLFSGFYLPLLIILVALIVRGSAPSSSAARSTTTPGAARCDCGIVFGSWVPAVLWGVAFANIVRGVDIDADKQVASGLFDLLNPYALLGGADDRLVFALHGAVFLALKTADEVRDGRRRTGAGWRSRPFVVAGGVRAVDAAGLRQGLDVDPRRGRRRRTARGGRAHAAPT